MALLTMAGLIIAEWGPQGGFVLPLVSYLEVQTGAAFHSQTPQPDNEPLGDLCGPHSCFASTFLPDSG